MVLDYDTQIEMLLFDQEKIVTYKEINNRFDITPREAQKVLKKFIDDHHNKSSGKKGQFAVVYLLILENVDTKKKKLQLVNERDLDTIEDDYKIISKQVYSIQSKPISDFNLIYSSDIDASNSLNRKSNLNVVFSAHEPQQENLMDTGSSHHHEETSKSSSNSSATSTTSSKPGSKPPASEHQVLRPSKESNKPSEPIKEKEHSKEIKVKEEPNEPKKIKLESSETASNIAAVKTGAAQSQAQAKPAAAAKPAAGGKNPPAKQSTLTSFFKKA